MATLLEKHLKLEEIKKIRNWRNEGYGLEKIKELVDKTNITDEEIEQIFYENSEKTQNEEKLDLLETNENSNKPEQQTERNIENIKEQNEAEFIYNNSEFVSEEVDEDEIEDLEEIEENKIEIEEENTIDDIKVENMENEKYEIVKDEDLEDFPNQPFKMYSESRKNTMIESIKINGIIEPIVVRKTETGKYQILSGHNRRICGREAGLKEFRCIVKENMTEDEARLYMVDSNLMVRDVMPTERGKALSIRKECLRNEKIASKIENEIMQDNVDKLERDGFEIIYVIEVEKQNQEVDLHYSANGTLIKSIVDTDNDEDEYLPVQLTEAIKNFIYKNYSNALIMEVDIENDRNDKYYGYTEVDIIHNRIHKEILFDSNGNWYSTSWEVHKNELPETVRNVIEKQYKEYNLDDAEYIEKANDTKYYRIDLELGETDLTVNIDSDGNVIP